MGRYVALLRGINVGGNNLIGMVKLKGCFEANGFERVTTYIQSGNVIFDAASSDRKGLVTRIEKMLTASFPPYAASVVLRSESQMRRIVAEAPKGFGKRPDEYRYDVLFLKDPLKPAVTMKSVLTREGVDQAYAGPGVIYFARVAAKATKSLLPRLASQPVYQQMTIRNWNTTVKILGLMAG